MARRIVPLPAQCTRSPTTLNVQPVLVICVCVMLLPCLGLILIEGRTPNQTSSPNHTAAVPLSATTTPPTKWWIKPTATPPATPLNNHIADTSSQTSTSRCGPGWSPALQPGTYGYVSLRPALPNRLRAGAGKSEAYLGQIQPGSGIRILDGPLCADGFSWWLVEAINTQVRGWTVMGSDSQPWLLPCPDPQKACQKVQAIPIRPTTTSTPPEENNLNKCKSIKLATGMFAQVAQADLLVLRSEPYTGSVVGRIGPLSVVKIVDGPACIGQVVWWQVHLATPNLTGWATEANLRACTKEHDCT